MTQQYKILAACSADERGRRKKLAPMGYAIHVSGPGISLKVLGRGVERDTHAMLVHGLLNGANRVFLECETPTIQVVLRNVGGELQFLFVEKWLSQLHETCLTRDNFEPKKNLHLLRELSHWPPFVKAEGREKILISELQKEAVREAASAYEDLKRNPRLYDSPGIFQISEKEA